MTLVLFDIDGTLLHTRGAGREALDVAFAEVHGLRAATEGVYIAGSLDGRILRDVEARHAVAVDHERVRAAYLRALAERLAVPGRATLCPGVEALVDRLEGRVEIALLTGNWEAGARLKLGAVGLAERFAWGVYAEDGRERADLVPVARRRAEARGLRPTRVVVVGDTPADIACARAGDAQVIAVETGFASVAELTAAGPDLQVPSLEAALPWLVAWLTMGSSTRQVPRPASSSV